MMRKINLTFIGKSLSSAVLMIAFLVIPSLIATSNNTTSRVKYPENHAFANRAADEAGAVMAEAGMLYESMDLEALGLPKQAFEYAFKGYKSLLNKGLVSKSNLITVADFSKSSRSKRLYILDVESQRVVMQTYVAHGRGSGGEYATSFSNTPESHKSSLGFYITKGTYVGQHGTSLVLDGLERGINDNAESRKIVIHGARYIGDRHLRSNPFTGRSHGCPAVANNLSKKIIQTIKDGSVLFIYHPTNSYLNKSRIING
ncbi:MAG TPA: murein L,D-transpeptidase catalytic domain family protein [Chitinophagaceae bacterium]